MKMNNITKQKAKMMSEQEREVYLNKKTAKISFVLTEAELDTLRELAYVNRKTTSEVLRIALLKLILTVLKKGEANGLKWIEEKQ